MQGRNALVTLTKKKRKSTWKLNAWCWLFMLPTFIFYIMFQAWPIISSAIYSLLDWSGLSKSAVFIGFENYQELMQDDLFWNAFLNSFKYMVMVVPLLLVVSLTLAYILNNERMCGREIFRTMYFIPVITTASVVGIIMVFIWSVQGPVNHLLILLKMIPKPINFLGGAKTAMLTVVLISLWKEMGIYMIYWLAGLQSVPKDVYEAAVVDGAGRVKTFFHIVLPMILPIGAVIATLCIINSLKVFDIVKTMTEGGPYYATDVIATYVYRLAFSSEIGMPRLGYASAASILFGAVVIVLGIIVNTIKNYFNKKRYI